jgi:hypothetical protein
VYYNVKKVEEIITCRIYRLWKRDSSRPHKSLSTWNFETRLVFQDGHYHKISQFHGPDPAARRYLAAVIRTMRYMCVSPSYSSDQHLSADIPDSKISVRWVEKLNQSEGGGGGCERGHNRTRETCKMVETRGRIKLACNLNK